MPYDTLVDKEKLERTFSEIGDAIRLKRDIANRIDVEDMPLQISLIDGGGGGGATQTVTVTYIDGTTQTIRVVV